MSTLTQLQTIVTSIVQDTEFTDSIIMGYLNRGVQEIAAGMQSAFGDFLTPPLPNLFSIGTVDTDISAAYVSMPATYQRGLRFAANESGVEIDISNSWIDFAETYPLLDKTGNIYEVIEQGGNLYYQGIPTASEEISIHFYRLPIDMAAASDTPDGIPSHLHVQLLTNYACKEIYNLIEDGIEGAQVNTAKHTALFYAALKTLEMSVPYDTRSLELI